MAFSFLCPVDNLFNRPIAAGADVLTVGYALICAWAGHGCLSGLEGAVHPGGLKLGRFKGMKVAKRKSSKVTEW